MSDDEASLNSVGGANEESTDLEDIPEVTERQKKVKQGTLVASGTAMAHIPLCFVGSGPIGGAVAAMGGGTTIATSPICNNNETEIKDIESFKAVLEKMTYEMDRMMAENKKLREQIKKLQESTGKMEGHQNALDAITSQQTQSIDEFEKQVERQKELLKELQEDARSGLLQTLLSIIVAADEDGDFTISESEVEPLIQSIEDSGILGVHHDRFKKKVHETGGDFQAVLDMCASIMQNNGGGEELPEDEQIFFIIEDKKEEKK